MDNVVTAACVTSKKNTIGMFDLRGSGENRWNRLAKAYELKDVSALSLRAFKRGGVVGFILNIGLGRGTSKICARSCSGAWARLFLEGFTSQSPKPPNSPKISKIQIWL